MTDSDIILFPHMPKCGGQSFRAGVRDAFGDSAHFVNLIPMPVLTSKKIHLFLWRIRNRFLPMDIPSNAKIVYGHICFDDLPSFKDRRVLRGTFFRDPVEWAGSYYFYSKRKYPKHFSGDIVHIIRKVGMDTAFKRYLGSVNVDDLDFVGLQEDYDSSLDLFERIFGIKIPLYYKNQNPLRATTITQYRRHFFELGVLDAVEDAMRGNQSIYERAVRRHRVLKEASMHPLDRDITRGY